MFNSFRSRLITVLVCLMMLVQFATAFSSLRTMKGENVRQGKVALEVASKVFAETLTNRATQLTTAVKVLTGDFAFKRAVATQEQFTVASVLENHGNRIGADLALLLSPEGRLLASTLNIPKQNPLQALMMEARKKGTAGLAKIIAIDEQAYQLVLVPVQAPTTIAWVGMGFALDNQLAEEVRNITGLEVSFARIEAEAAADEASQPVNTINTAFGKLQKLVTTVERQDSYGIFSQFNDANPVSQDAVFSEDESYLSLFVPLTDSPQQALAETDSLWAILHLPFGPWMKSYHQARAELSGIFALTLVLAILLGWYATNNLTRPILKLAAYANRIGSGQPGKPPRIRINELDLLSQTLADMRKNIEKRERQLREQSSRDGLTGLANRVAVETYLASHIPRENGCLVLINIRQFKNINTMLGFDNGDKLLCEVAHRLKTLDPEPELLARLGGDEFLMIFSESLDPVSINRTLSPLEKSFLLSGSSLHLRLSIGVLPFDKSHHTVNDIMRRIDIATLTAKNDPQGIMVYQGGEDETHQRELAIIRDLPVSLNEGHVYVVYQPKVSLQQKQCLSAEALIRWQHPELGFIPPDHFISLIENAGNIHLVTQWMLQEVIRQLSLWWQAGMKMQVAVNLSANDLCDPELPSQLQQGLNAANLPPEALALEVTEGAVMQDADVVISVLQQLKAMGIQLAIDDFGTGQSSLAYLKQLPVHEVKIDRAFVKDIENNNNDELIVNATTQLSHSLGFKVTAEGLENISGLSKVAGCGCDTVQGYYFSKPLKAEDFARWVSDFHLAPDKWFNA